MGEALPPMRLINRLLVGGGVVLCLAATGAGPRHSRQAVRYPHIRSPRPVFAVAPTAPRRAPSAKPPPPKLHIPTAADLYPKSLHADDLYSYRGRQITTYWRSGHTEAVVISHRAPDLRRIDYLAPYDERGRSVVTSRSERWQYDPRSRQLLHRRLARNAQAVADAAQSYDLLRSNYVLEVEPKPRMLADRKAFVLAITRKPSHTLARKLWIDASTGLVLKREYYREDGKAALTIAFSDINYHAPLPLSLFDLAALAKRPGVKTVNEPSSSETSLPLGTVHSQLGGAALAPQSLNGYRLVSAALTENRGTPILHLRYSDGLNLVSLFEQRRTQPRRPTHVPATMRKTRIGRRDGHVEHQASLTALNWDTATLNLTLMGELAEMPLKELALAADSGGRP